MADITVDVNWQIMPATETKTLNDNRFDQISQGDEPFGPRPEAPPAGPPELDGKM